MGKKSKKSCPTDWTFLEEDNNEDFYGRCVETQTREKTIQIASIDSTTNYGKLPEGEKEEFLVGLTEFEPETLKLNTKETKDVLESFVLEPEDDQDFNELEKALHHKQYGFGNSIELGEVNKYSGKRYLAKVAKTKEEALKVLQSLPKEPEY